MLFIFIKIIYRFKCFSSGKSAVMRFEIYNIIHVLTVDTEDIG